MHVLESMHVFLVGKICNVRCFPEERTPADINFNALPCEITVVAENVNFNEMMIKKKWATNGTYCPKKPDISCDELDSVEQFGSDLEGSFRPGDASTRVSSPNKDTSLQNWNFPELSYHFKPFILKSHIKSFRADVVRAVNPGTLYLIPCIPQKNNYLQFLNKLQKIKNASAESMCKPKLHEKILCKSGKSVGGNLWHRGIVIEVGVNLVTAFLVDTLEFVTVGVESVAKFPKELEDEPLFCLKAQLHNTKSAGLAPEKINKIIEDKSIYVKVVTKNDPIEVILYENQTMQKQIL